MLFSDLLKTANPWWASIWSCSQRGWDKIIERYCYKMLHCGMSKWVTAEGPTENGLQNWKELGLSYARILDLAVRKNGKQRSI